MVCRRVKNQRSRLISRQRGAVRHSTHGPTAGRSLHGTINDGTTSRENRVWYLSMIVCEITADSVDRPLQEEKIGR